MGSGSVGWRRYLFVAFANPGLVLSEVGETIPDSREPFL